MSWTEEFERMAKAGKPIPEELRPAEIPVYIALRGLYFQFDAGLIDREQGRQDKRRIMVGYERLRNEYAMLEQHWKIRRRLEAEIGNLHAGGCERCRKFMRVFDGVDRRDPPEDAEKLHAWNERLRELVKERSERAAALRSQIERIRWTLAEESSAEEKLAKIKEVIQE